MTQSIRMVVRRTADSVTADEILTAASIVGLAVLLRAVVGLL